MYTQLPSSAPHDPALAKNKKAIRSTLVSRNVTIAGHRTSVRLEPDMWSGLIKICRRERVTLHDLSTKIAHAKNQDTSLTAAIRVHIMNYYRAASTEDGHFKAGHGSGMRMAVPSMRTTVPGVMTGGALNGHGAPNMPHAVTPAANPSTAHAAAQSSAGQRTSPSTPFMIGMGRMTSSGSIR